MTNSTFSDLGLIEPLTKVLAAENYAEPTPIQLKAVPVLLEGRDLLGIAQTGTGKTAAFGLPLLQMLSQTQTRAPARSCRALVLAPTRELAIQIEQSLNTYGSGLKLSLTAIFGGVSQNRQVQILAKGVDIVVATPGRLLDLISQRHLKLDQATTFVIDEADRMFDMGFIRDVRRIVSLLPKQRQSMLFSATMPDEVVKLVGDVLKTPVRIEVAPQSRTAERVEQRVVFVEMKEKRALLAHLLRAPDVKRAIVFTRTKHGANRVAETLEKSGFAAEAIHGNKSQNARQRALARFRSGEAPILVATDIAARGIDIDDITHVFNFELPHEPESYVHRIGRTARAGASGVAISLVDGGERGLLKQIERVTRQSIKHMQVDGVAPLPAPERSTGERGEPRREDRRDGQRENQRDGQRPGQHPRKTKPHRKGQNRPRGDAPQTENRGGGQAPRKPQAVRRGPPSR